MDTGQQLVLMPYLSRVEGIVENASHRGVGEEPGACGMSAVAVGQLLGVPGPESLVVEPGCQRRQGDRARGVAGEQLPDRGILFRVDVDPAGVGRLTSKLSLAAGLCPA